jgi:Ni/Fe-hydrogenase 1 B-type cytochrome subunit
MKQTNQDTTNIRRVAVWSGWLRLSHLVVGSAVLLLMITGWLMRHAPSVEAAAVDWHYLAAALLVPGMVLRIWLLFAGRPVERGSQWMPADDEWHAVAQTLRFYLSLGRAPLPRWYAHNPLWKPLYLLLYLLLGVLLLTGALYEQQPLLAGIYLPDVHRVFATAVTLLVVAHVLTVLWHDWKGQADDVSAIINGHRLFVTERPGPDGIGLRETVVPLDQIGRPPRDD